MAVCPGHPAVVPASWPGATRRAWRLAYIYTSPYPVRGSLGLYPSTFIPTADDPTPMLDALRRCRPQLLAVYPTVLRDLLAADAASMRRLDLRGVAVSSEHSTSEERRGWAEILGCPVGDQYSSEELAYIAAECAAGAYHLVEDMTYVEILAAGSDRPVDGRRARWWGPSSTTGRCRSSATARAISPGSRRRTARCRPAAGTGSPADRARGPGQRRVRPGRRTDACRRGSSSTPAIGRSCPDRPRWRPTGSSRRRVDRTDLEVVPGTTWAETRRRACFATRWPSSCRRDLRVDVRVVERLERAGGRQAGDDRPASRPLSAA